MYSITQSSRFKKDLKKISHDKEKLIALKAVIQQLQATGTVSKEHFPHQLKGDYNSAMECHILSDFLIIWIDSSSKEIKLLRLGSHSELFK